MAGQLDAENKNRRICHTTGLVISISTNELTLAIHLEASKDVLWPGKTVSDLNPNCIALGGSHHAILP
jgi:hypothetical protein